MWWYILPENKKMHTVLNVPYLNSVYSSVLKASCLQHSYPPAWASYKQYIPFFITLFLLLYFRTACMDVLYLDSIWPLKHFPKSPNSLHALFVFPYNPLSRFSAASRWMSGGLSMGQGNLREAQKKLTLPPLAAINYQGLSVRSGALWDSPTQAAVLTDLTLCSSCTSKHSSYEFMSALALMVRRRHSTAGLPNLWLLDSFYILFSNVSLKVGSHIASPLFMMWINLCYLWFSPKYAILGSDAIDFWSALPTSGCAYIWGQLVLSSLQTFCLRSSCYCFY